MSVLFGYNADNKKQSKPDKLAIVDDGVGMIPEMITYSVMWGGTDRENDRTGFGRYGYGLPSSAVSIAKRYTVYSRSKGEDWHAVTVDIDALSEVASDPNKTRELLSSRPAKLPEWVVESSNDVDLAAEESGTVIVLEEPDRLRRLGGWIMTKSLEQKLLQSFGTIYRHWIPARRMSVNGVQVEPVDPLFLMEHGRYFGDNRIRAKRVDTRAFDVDLGDGETGIVTLRASVLPPSFQLADPTQYGKKGAKLLKGRWDVMRSYNGLLICREGRQIDCINPRFTKFQTYDANVRIEIDFDAALDEFFGITTSKQQIVIDDEMWEKLENAERTEEHCAPW